jgi:hypothetical protein
MFEGVIIRRKGAGLNSNTFSRIVGIRLAEAAL